MLKFSLAPRLPAVPAVLTFGWITPVAPATIVTSTAGSRNQVSPLPFVEPSRFFLDFGTRIPPSELVLVVGLLPITWLFPDSRRIPPLPSTLPESLTLRTFGATLSSPTEVPATTAAETNVALAGIA
ncbi:hypothetical protein B0E55_01259 [Rhodococcus sp. 66b]|nr:hypothetical protein B0E55_01259 [Rhodococcus sp. 66b]